MTPEEMAKHINDVIAGGTPVLPIAAPVFSCSGFRVSMNTNECVVVLQRQHPVLVVPTGEQPIEASQAQPVAIVSMSPQSIKDLLLLLIDQVKLYEEQWGEIETEYSRSRVQQK